MSTITLSVHYIAVGVLVFAGLALALGWRSGGFKMILVAVGLTIIGQYLTLWILVGVFSALVLFCIGRLRRRMKR